MFTAKNIAIFLGLAVVAFGTATIVLAIQKDNLNSELNYSRERIERMEEELRKTTTTGTQITSTTEGSDHSPTSSSSEESSTISVSPPSVTTSTISVSSTYPGSTEDPGHEQVT